VNTTAVAIAVVPATVEAGGQVVLSVEAPLEEPGLYWVKAVPVAGAEPWRRKRLGIIYDANNYRPPLTRPDDFTAFWQEQLKKTRSIPFKPKLVENHDYAIEATRLTTSKSTGTWGPAGLRACHSDRFWPA
jgi:hypothetical protein